MQAIFPESIDGDLLRLVHSSNGFRMIVGQEPLTGGDVCQSEAHVVSVINNDSGKAVKVKGQALRSGKPVVEVVSSFLYRGRFTDFKNTFENIQEPDYTVEVKTDSDVWVYSSRRNGSIGKTTRTHSSVERLSFSVLRQKFLTRTRHTTRQSRCSAISLSVIL